MLEWLEDRIVLDTYHVTSVLDSGPGTLRDAVTQANAHPGKDTIVFDLTGIHGINLDTPLPDLADDVDIQGTGAANLGINTAFNSGSFPIFTIDSGVAANISSMSIVTLGSGLPGNTLVNHGGMLSVIDCKVTNSSALGSVIVNSSGMLTISGCNVSGGGPTVINGGAIYNAGTVTIRNSSVSGTATGFGSNGGAVYNLGTMTVSDSTLSGEAKFFGGGVYNKGSMTVTGSNLSGSTFDLNGGRGGAIYNLGTMTFSGGTLTGTAMSGGGIDNESTMTVSGSSLSGSAESDGGGIYNIGTLTLSDSTVSGCVAGSLDLGVGGGIYNNGTLAVYDSTLSGNSAVQRGGGISNGGPLTVVNSTLTGNSTTDYDGGLGGGAGISFAFSKQVTLTNVTITHNRSADAGGGIYVGGDVAPTLHNTLITGNSSSLSNGGNDVYGSLGPSSDYNLIGDGTGMTGISNGTNHNLVGTSANPLNPLIAPLGNYGGPTQTVALLPGSPAIDAGSAAYGGPTDQRGFSRVGPTDIGAFESQGFRVTATSGDGQSAAVNTPFTSPLSVTISSDFGEPVQNGVITFTAPASGASATIPAGSSATINASGQASVIASANAVAGQYVVTATAAGLAMPASFILTNTTPVVPAMFLVYGFPSVTEAGAPHPFTVLALDAGGNVVTGYTGTVAFTSNDPKAVLPANSILTNGVGTFTATLKTAGTDRITVTDTRMPSLTGSETGITVNPAATSQFLVTGFPTSTEAGVAHSFTVMAQDAYGNTTPAYNGRVIFSSNDPQAILPRRGRLNNGVGTFTATLKTAGTNRVIQVLDKATLTITGAQTGIIVTPTAAKTLVVSGFPLTTEAGVAHSFTVTARDAYGNVATDYPGTVAFRSDDLLATLPRDSTLNQGVGTFTATLRTVGNNHYLRALDISMSSIRGAETGITVTSPPGIHRGSTALAGDLEAFIGIPSTVGNAAKGATDMVRIQSHYVKATQRIDNVYMPQAAGKNGFDETILITLDESHRTSQDVTLDVV
jgi:hypothetical protein